MHVGFIMLMSATGYRHHDRNVIWSEFCCPLQFVLARTRKCYQYGQENIGSSRYQVCMRAPSPLGSSYHRCAFCLVAGAATFLLRHERCRGDLALRPHLHRRVLCPARGRPGYGAATEAWASGPQSRGGLRLGSLACKAGPA